MLRSPPLPSEPLLALRSANQLLAKASGINTKTELPILLELLEERGLIDKGQSGIEVLGVTTAATLQHTANMFDDSGPTNAERAALEISVGISHIGSLQAQRAAQTRWEHHSQVLQGQSIAGLSNKRCVCSRRAPFLSVFIVLVSPASGVKPH